MFEIAKFKFYKKEYDLSICILDGKEASREVYQQKDSNKKEIIYIVKKDITKEGIIKLSEKIKDDLRDVEEFNLDISNKLDGEFLIECILLGLTDINVYNSNYKKPKTYKVNANDFVKNAYKYASKSAPSYNVARMLSHLPYQEINPDTMAKNIKSILDDKRFKITISRQKECKKNKIVGMTSLSAGSMYEPAYIKVEFNNKGTKKIGLVGKGVTFDSGGYNVKSGDITSMKTDMAGSTAVIGTMKRLADLDIKCNVTAYLMFTDNIINEKSLMPGQVLQYPNGVSVEIGNTDAEGRLILADGLILASKDKCESVIDIATLTGNIVAAIGKKYAGLYTTDKKQRDIFVKNNDILSEKVWPMPLEDDYSEFLKGNISDIRNIASNKHAGSITAALFLKNFIDKDIKWTHIDMAAMSRKEEYSTPANGFGVRLLTEFIKSYEK